MKNERYMKSFHYWYDVTNHSGHWADDKRFNLFLKDLWKTPGKKNISNKIEIIKELLSELSELNDELVRKYLYKAQTIYDYLDVK